MSKLVREESVAEVDVPKKSNVEIKGFYNDKNNVQLVGFNLNDHNLGLYFDIEDEGKTYIEYYNTIRQTVLNRNLEINIHVDNFSTDQLGVIQPNANNTLRLNADIKMELGYGLSVGRSDINITTTDDDKEDNVTKNLGISHNHLDGTKVVRVTDTLLSSGYYAEYNNNFNNINVFLTGNDDNNLLIKLGTELVNNSDTPVNLSLAGVIYNYQNNIDAVPPSKQLTLGEISANGNLPFQNFSWLAALSFGENTNTDESLDLGYDVSVEMSERLFNMDNLAYNFRGNIFNRFDFNQAHNVSNDTNSTGFISGFNTGLDILYKLDTFDIGLSVDYVKNNGAEIKNTQDSDIINEPEVLTYGVSLNSNLFSIEYLRMDYFDNEVNDSNNVNLTVRL